MGSHIEGEENEKKVRGIALDQGSRKRIQTGVNPRKRRSQGREEKKGAKTINGRKGNAELQLIGGHDRPTTAILKLHNESRP